MKRLLAWMGLLAAGCGGLTRDAESGAATATMPALVDHHVHLLNVGLWLLNDRDGGRLFLDLSQAGSLEEVGRLVNERTRGIPEGGWVVGAGWSQGNWGTQALPSHEVLSRAAPRHPVFLARTDGHAGWVNAAAMERGRITGSGGVLLEGDNEPVTRLIPAPADSDIVTAFQLAARAFAERGVTEVHDAGFLAFPGVVALNTDFGRYLRLLRQADSVAPLPVRVNLMIPAPSALAESLLAGSHEWRLSPRIRITHLKLFGDGALGSRGAALTHPYADDSSTTGVARLTSGEIAAWSRRAIGAGLGVATHAIGDEAVKRALDAYQTVLGELRDLPPGTLRIEHFSYAREEDFARAVGLGITLSIQSNFNSGADDAPTFGGLRVGDANEPRVYAWRRLFEMQARLSEGSDYFARPGEPLDGFLAAMTRRNAVGAGHDDSATRAAVYRMHASTTDGDSVTWTEDPLTVPLARLSDIRARRTRVDGRVTSVFQERTLEPRR